MLNFLTSTDADPTPGEFLFGVLLIAGIVAICKGIGRHNKAVERKKAFEARKTRARAPYRKRPPRPRRGSSYGAYLRERQRIQKIGFGMSQADTDFLEALKEGEFERLIKEKKLAINSDFHFEVGSLGSASGVKPPVLYLIRTTGSYKIGISKTMSRLHSWLSDGWAWMACVSTAHLEESVDAVYHIESQLLRHYRSVGACPNPRPPVRMRDGKSETLKPDQVRAEEIVQRAVNELAKAEQLFGVGAPQRAQPVTRAAPKIPRSSG